VRLDPATYVCTTHDVDLTSQVEAVLADEVVVASYMTAPVPANQRPTANARFTVAVECPATEGVEAHKLVFDGTRLDD